MSFNSYKNFFYFLKLFIVNSSSYKYKKKIKEMIYYEKEFIKSVSGWMYGC